MKIPYQPPKILCPPLNKKQDQKTEEPREGAEDKLGEEGKVFYLCNGEVPYCTKKNCYKNNPEGPCRHTRDIEYAENFKKLSESHSGYWEEK